MNGFDVEAYCDTAKLGLAVATLRILGVDAENPVPVAVESQRCSMGQDMDSQRQKIGSCGFCRGKLQGRQTACCIVNENNQGAAGATSLEPVMERTINLDQFAKARPPFTQLKHPLLLPSLGTPQFVFDLQPPHCLA